MNLKYSFSFATTICSHYSATCKLILAKCESTKWLFQGLKLKQQNIVSLKTLRVDCVDVAHIQHTCVQKILPLIPSNSTFRTMTRNTSAWDLGRKKSLRICWWFIHCTTNKRKNKYIVMPYLNYLDICMQHDVLSPVYKSNVHVCIIYTHNQRQCRNLSSFS